jgi:hypothetical protein
VPVDAHNYEDDDVYEIEEKETEWIYSYQIRRW